MDVTGPIHLLAPLCPVRAQTTEDHTSGSRSYFISPKRKEKIYKLLHEGEARCAQSLRGWIFGALLHHPLSRHLPDALPDIQQHGGLGTQLAVCRTKR